MSAEVQQQYAQLNDDEILRIAADMEDLTPEAQVSLREELRHRQLTDGDIAETAERVEQWKREEKAATGIKQDVWRGALTYYGKRNVAQNGDTEEFDSTLFLTPFYYFPLIPLGTYRRRRKLDGSTEVMERLPMDWSQAGQVWLVGVAIVALIYFAVSFLITLRR